MIIHKKTIHCNYGLSPLLFSLLWLWGTLAYAQDDRKVVQITDLTQLEGNYNLIAYQDTAYVALDWISMMDHRLNWVYFRDHKCSIRLQKTDKNKLTFTLWEAEKKLATSRMKARIIDGKVHITKTKFRLFTLILNVVNSHQADIALTENGDILVLDAQMGGCGLIVFFPIACAGDKAKDLLYKRVSENGN